MATGQRGNGGFRKKMWQRGNSIFETSVARATGQRGNGGFGKALPICGNGAMWQRYYSGKRRPMVHAPLHVHVLTEYYSVGRPYWQVKLGFHKGNRAEFPLPSAKT